MKYFIITGTSKGLGDALATRLIREGHTLFCISRTRNEKLIELAKGKNVPLFYYEKDLGYTGGVDRLMSEIFKNIDLDIAEHISFINNAGVISPIKTFSNITEDDIVTNLNVNLISPMIITNYFMKELQGFSGDKRIINISSGAGKRPLPSWGPYCVSKAGIDMITRVIAAEEKEDGVKVISFAPGIMDTYLQEDIRSTSGENFELLDNFKGYKEDGKLLDADYVAERVERVLFSEDFEQGALKSVSDYE